MSTVCHRALGFGQWELPVDSQNSVHLTCTADTVCQTADTRQSLTQRCIVDGTVTPVS